MFNFYTSYFANIKNLPNDFILIAICGKKPIWFNGLHYKKLAPSYDLFTKWKVNKDNDWYIKKFNIQLQQLNFTTVIYDLTSLAKQFNKCNNVNYNNICLLCYESPNKFCHRHLVSKYLTDNNIKCIEYSKDNFI